MKSHAVDHTLEHFGVEAVSDFTIRANGKAFRVLIDGLYSDKIGSMVRELCTNAFDSMLMAGAADKAFFVHAPDSNIPEFYVRDYGTGMDHEKVTQLYTQLFASDKDDSNDQVGMMGLGSKSPFAYPNNDQFFVHCYDGPVEATASTPERPGSVRHYICAIGPRGVPQLLYHGMEESDEKTGVKVGFAVREEDFSAFEKAIRNVSAGFTPCFESNATVESLDDLKSVLKGHGWRSFDRNVYTGGNHGSNASWFVRQGCVIYPLTGSEGLELPVESKHRYIMDMPIGSVEVTASREAVSYNTQTVNAIRARLNLVKSQVADMVDAAVKDIPTISAFCSKLHSVKPNWVDREYKHPPTGLTSASWTFQGVDGLFTAALEKKKARWTFATRHSLSFADNDTTQVYILDDITPLLDPVAFAASEPPIAARTHQLNATERRRIARLVRRFCEANGLEQVTIAIGIAGWTEDFFKATVPSWRRLPMTVEDLKNAVPSRPKIAENAEPARPLIRGLALAKAQSDQTPVEELPRSLEGAAWVSAEEWRRRSSIVWRLRSRLQIKSLFIASAVAQPLVINAGVRSLAQAATEHMQSFGLSPIQFATITRSMDHYGKTLMKIGAATYAQDEALYDKVARAKGMVSDVFRLLKPYVRFLHSMGDQRLESDEAEVLIKLLFGEDGKFASDDKIASVCNKPKANSNHFVYKVSALHENTDMCKGPNLPGFLATIMDAQRYFPDYKSAIKTTGYY